MQTIEVMKRRVGFEFVKATFDLNQHVLFTVVISLIPLLKVMKGFYKNHFVKPSYAKNLSRIVINTS